MVIELIIKLIDPVGFIAANRQDAQSYRLALTIAEFSKWRQLHVIGNDGPEWLLNVYGPCWRGRISQSSKQYFEVQE